MKSLIVAILITVTAEATTFTKYRTTADGVSSQKFIFKEKNIIFEKTSNYFDLKGKDYRIGIHKLNGTDLEYIKLMNKVEEYSTKFKEVDDFLKTKGSSFNDVAGVIKHEPVIIVNDFRIKPESKYYAELDGIFKKLRGLNWKLETGYKLSDNLEKVLEYKNGKEVKSSPYARDLYCQKANPPTMCTFYGGGQVYVK